MKVKGSGFRVRVEGGEAEEPVRDLNERKGVGGRGGRGGCGVWRLECRVYMSESATPRGTSDSSVNVRAGASPPPHTIPAGYGPGVVRLAGAPVKPGSMTMICSPAAMAICAVTVSRICFRARV